MPVFFRWAPKGTEVPYIVYFWENEDNFGADDLVYQRVANVEIRVYSNSPAEEIGAALDAENIYWQASSEYDDTEQLYTTIYTFTAIETTEEINNG